MRIILLSCWNCKRNWLIKPTVDQRGHIEIPRTLCGRCHVEIRYEIKEIPDEN